MWLWQDSGDFYFLYTWWYFSDFPQRTCIVSVIWKKKKINTGYEKYGGKMGGCVPEKTLHSFFVSRICVHATKWVQWALFIPRDQLSVIANLKENYQQEAETVISWNYTWESPLVGDRGAGSAPNKMHWHT